MRDDDKGMRGTNSLAKSLFFMARAEIKERLIERFPYVDRACVLGVKPDLIASFADEFADLSTKDAEDFLSDMPHRYFEEYLLHMFLEKSLGLEEELLHSPLVPEEIKEALRHF